MDTQLPIDINLTKLLGKFKNLKYFNDLVVDFDSLFPH